MSAVDGVFRVQDVVYAGLKKSGIISQGMTIDGTVVLDAQNDLSDMMAQWNAKTWLTFNKLDLGFVSDGRAGPTLGGAYTVGPGGNYNVTPRPDRIEAAYLRILANTNISGSGMPVDQPLMEVQSHETYSRISLKQLVAFTKAYFYDTSYTSGGGQTPGTATSLGNVYFYPWPQASLYEMHIIVKNVFPLVLPLNTDLSGLPPPCRAALKFNLAKRLRQAYGKGLRPDPELNGLAKDSLETMRASQVQVPELSLPGIVLGRGSLYNIFGDNFY